MPVVEQRRDGLERRRDLYHFGPERPQARSQVDHAAGHHLRVLLRQPLDDYKIHLISIAYCDNPALTNVPRSVSRRHARAPRSHTA